MVLINAFKDWAIHIVDFTGKTDKATYWWGLLAAAIVEVVLCWLPLYWIAFELAFISATVRRLRDTGESWKQIFWMLIPVYGVIWWVQHCIKPSAN